DEKEHDFDAKKPESKVNVSPSSSAQSRKQDDKIKKEAKEKSPVESFTGYRNLSAEFEDCTNNSINKVNDAGTIVPGQNSPNNTNTFSAAELEDITYFDDEDDVGAEADFNNLETSITISPIPTTRVHKDHPVSQIIGDLSLTTQTRSMTRVEEPKRVHQALKDPSWIEAMQEELFQFKMQKVWVLVDLPNGKRAIGHTHEEEIDYEEVFAPIARIEAIRLFLAYASFMGFMMYQMDVNSAFLYGTIEEEVYVCQPPGFEDPDHPDKVYKVVKALYDDIIFGATNKDLCKSFEKLMKDKFQLSSMGELTFFLGLQVKKKKDGIFISQDKYIAEILRKFGLTKGKSASTPIDTEKPLLKDHDGEDVDVHTYRSMIGSLMYLTSSRPDIMFAVCACVHFQVTPKASHLHAVKRIFRYLKGKQQLGLWYLKDSPFDLVAYLDSDYAGASLDRKSTTKGCQFLGCRLISWQCKKQTVVVTSSTEAEYVAAASCCAQVLWIKNQLLDYGLQALVDRKKVVVTEAAIRECMSAKRTSWNEFGSSMASAVICLSTGKGFSGVETPLFERMLVEQEIEEEEDADEHAEEVTAGDDAHGDDSAAHGEVSTVTQEPFIPSPTPPTPPPQPSQDPPSTSQLKRRVKKLKKRNKVRVLKLKRLQRVRTSQRIDTSNDTVMDDASNHARMIDTSNDTVMDDASNHARMIAEIDKDDVVVLMDDKEEDKKVEEAKVDESAQVQGRQAESQTKIYKIDMDYANKVLNMLEDETKPAKVQEVVDVVTTAKLITKVVIAASETVTAASAIISTAEPQVPAATLTVAPARVAAAPKEPKPLKKKQQIEQDEQYARELHAELNKERATKRRKLDEEVEDLKRHLQIMPNEDDDVYTEATPLARKVPVVDYEIIELNNKPHYKIIRADETHQPYVSFLSLLKIFNREDLEALWNLIKERYTCSDLEESENYTWSSESQRMEATGIMWYVPTVTQEPSIPSPSPPTPPPQPPQDLPSTSKVQKTPPQSPQVQPPPQPHQAVDFPMSLLQEALDACAALTRRVEHLEYDKVAQALKITKLKRRVKKLENGNKGRMIAEMDKDDAVVLMDEKEEDKKVEEAKVVESAQVQGRQAESQAEIYKIDMDHANKVLSMQDDETEAAEVQEVVDVVTTTKVAATPSRRRKGVVIKDPEKKSTTSTIIPETKSKNRGKKILVEDPKPLKKKQQIEMDEIYARKLHAELNKDIDWDVAIDHVKLKAKLDTAIKRYQAMKRKPQTEAQAKKNMMMYLKNVVGFKLDYFKGMSYDNIPKKAAKRRKLNEEVEDLKRHLEIVPDEDDDVYTEATPLARKVPIVDYEIIELNNKPYYKITRVDGTHQLYISFLTLLKNFDREDLEALWNLVKQRFSSSKTKSFSNDFLLTTLGAMFEKPDVHAQI
nr:putative ribonuclease H-like domain-containing protein [Tanacetum cinerariifolium]